MSEPDSRSIRRFQLFASSACFAVMAMAVGALAGWMFGIEHLKNLIPGAPTMKPNTALAFVAAAVALGLRDPWQRVTGPRVRWIAHVCAGFAAAIGLLTLLEYGLD